MSDGACELKTQVNALASMLLRSLSAVSQSLASKPMVAVSLLADLAGAGVLAWSAGLADLVALAGLAGLDFALAFAAMVADLRVESTALAYK